MSDTLEVLRKILVEQFDKNPAQILPESTLESLEIDSIETFEILFSAEDAFGIKVPNDQVEIQTLADVVNLIDQLRAAQGRT